MENDKLWIEDKILGCETMLEIIYNHFKKIEGGFSSIEDFSAAEDKFYGLLEILRCIADNLFNSLREEDRWKLL